MSAADAVSPGTDLPFGYDDVVAFLARTVDADPRPGRPAPFARTVAELAALGLPAGAPVLIASSGRRLLEQYFAALLTGAVPMAVSPATGYARILRLARELGAGAVVAARLRPQRYGAARVARVGGGDAVLLPYTRPGRRGTVLMLTSGTSGMFSACLHRVGSLVRNARRHADAVGLRADDTVLVSLPLFYSYAIVAQAFAALLTGARLVVSGPPFSPVAYRRLVAECGVTASSVTPTIARLLLAHGRPLPAGLRMLTVGGDRIAPEQVGALLAPSPNLELYVTYGLTEAGPRVSTLAAHREPASRHGSVGLPLAGVTARLRAVPGGAEAGELVVTSDTVMIGRLGAGPADRGLVAPGVVATGDLFRIDDDGYLHFAGRISDFMVVRGEKVSLYAIRQFVQSLPGVVRSATSVGTDPAGSAYYDLDVQVAGDASGAHERIRRAVRSFLLRGERPRTITVAPADLAVFRK